MENLENIEGMDEAIQCLECGGIFTFTMMKYSMLMRGIDAEETLSYCIHCGEREGMIKELGKIPCRRNSIIQGVLVPLKEVKLY